MTQICKHGVIINKVKCNGRVHEVQKRYSLDNNCCPGSSKGRKQRNGLQNKF